MYHPLKKLFQLSSEDTVVRFADIPGVSYVLPVFVLFCDQQVETGMRTDLQLILPDPGKTLMPVGFSVCVKNLFRTCNVFVSGENCLIDHSCLVEVGYCSCVNLMSNGKQWIIV